MPSRRLDYAEILRLRDEEGLKFSEIAERLGCSKSTVSDAFYRVKSGKTSLDRPEKTRAPRGKTSRTRTPENAHVRGEVRDEAEEVRELSRTLRALPEWKEVQEVLEWCRMQMAREQESRTRTTHDAHAHIAHRAPRAQEPMISRGVRIRRDLFEEVQKYAEEKGVSVNEAINRIVEAGLK